MTADLIRIANVKTYSGYKADEKPLEFLHNGSVVKIDEVLSRNIIENATDKSRFLQFKVRFDGKRIATLSKNLETEEWFIEE